MEKRELLDYELCFDEVSPITEKYAYEGLRKMYFKWLVNTHPELFDKKIKVEPKQSLVVPKPKKFRKAVRR